MSELIVRENPQLRRLERTIAELEARPAAERLRKQTLLMALYSERDEITGARSR